MLRVSITRWAGWAPGLEGRPHWESWCRAPRALEGTGSPDAHFLPPMFRRRCSPLSKLMLHVAYECGSVEELSQLAAVFASRHGEAEATLAMLESLAREEPVTASRFSHSVHNTQAGLFSIAAKNRQISSALAGGADTFVGAFLEALTVLHRGAGRPVLLVMADEPLPLVLRGFVDEPPAPYALALVVSPPASRGTAIGFTLAGAGEARSLPSWPQALEFLRWFLSDEPTLALGAGRARGRWTRLPPHRGLR